jgi:hypothetical protein
MSLGLARGRTLIPLGNPARDTRRPKCWKSQHFGRLVSALGSTFNVNGQDFPGNFSGATATLGGAAGALDSTGLTISETFTPVSPTQEWVVFNFGVTANHTTIIGSGSANFAMSITGVHTNGPAVLSQPFAYFTHSGTAYSPLHATSGFGTESNPISGSFPVLDFAGFTPGAAATSFGLDIFSNPASFLSAAGIDVTTANDFHFGALLTLPVPEPSSLALIGGGLLGLGAVRRGRPARRVLSDFFTCVRRMRRRPTRHQ